MASQSPPGRAFAVFVTVLVVLIGLALLVISSFSFRWMRAAIRLIGVLLLVGSVPAYFARRHIRQYVCDVLASFSRLLRALVDGIRRGWSTRESVHLWAFVAIVLLGIVLRVAFLSQPMRLDETYSFYKYASQPLRRGLASYTPNNHPFHTLQVHMAYVLLGQAPWVVRLPAFLAGVLVVPASYLALRLLYNKHVGLVTAGLVASSSALIDYATQARGYSFIGLMFLLLLALASYLRRHREPAAWLCFSVLGALGFYAIPVMLYPFGIVVLWCLVSVLVGDANLDRTRFVKDLAVAVAITVLLVLVLYLPIFVVSGVSPVVANKFVAPRPWARFVRGFVGLFRLTWGRWNAGIPAVLKGVLVVGFVGSLALHKRIAAHRVPVVLAVLLWCVPVMMLQRVVPYIRVWFFLLPLYFGLASSGLVGLLSILERWGGRAKSPLLAGGAVALSVWMGAYVLCTQSVLRSPGAAPLKDAKPMALFLGDNIGPDDGLVCSWQSGVFLGYYFDVYGISGKCLRRDFNTARRLFVVVSASPRHNESLATLFRKKGLSGSDWATPRIVREYESATLYEVTRVPGGDEAP